MVDTAKVIPLHRITQVPYTVEGPYTKDSQEHHEFEDGLSIAIARVNALNAGIRFLHRVALLLIVSASLGYATERGWIDWSLIAEKLGAM